MTFLTDATPAHEFGSMKDPLPSKTTMLPLSLTPDTASKGLRTLAPWNVIRLEMSPPTVTFGANFYSKFFTDCLSFHLQGPRIVVLSLSPLTVVRSTFGQSSGFTTDSPALESTAISRYRPRSPSVATSLLSMDLLPLVTAFRSTSSGLHAPSLELSLGRSSPSLEMSYCGALIGRLWYTPSFWHTEQTGKSAERQPFTSGTDFGAFRAQGSTCCKASNCSCFPSQQSRNGSFSSR